MFSLGSLSWSELCPNGLSDAGNVKNVLERDVKGNEVCGLRRDNGRIIICMMWRKNTFQYKSVTTGNVDEISFFTEEMKWIYPPIIQEAISVNYSKVQESLKNSDYTL